jgi:pimeloyl-ACP methyl ester carboxylesterase
MVETTQVHLVRGKDVALEVYVDGSGPALVVLPSYGRGAGEDFDSFARMMSTAGFRVLRPQPRGVAGSKGKMDGITLHDQADDVALVIRELTDGAAVVLGHAFGHGVAKTVAEDYSSLVLGAILASAQCSAVPPDIARTPHQACDLAAPIEERLAALRKGFFAPNHDASIWLSGWYPETMQMQVNSVKRTPTKEFSMAGNAPLLEIIPDSDPFKPRAYWGELRQQFGDRVTTEVVVDASHALFPEQPDRVADIVIEWYRRLIFRTGKSAGS